MAVAGAPWQFECKEVQQRFDYLLKSGLWADCYFVLGTEDGRELISAHKLVLAMASPVFEAMFYGELSECKDFNWVVPVPKLKPETFRALLRYIYTGVLNIEIGSFDMALDLWHGANKYKLPDLVKYCNSFICSIVDPTNACRAFEFARLYGVKTVMDKCIQIISRNTKEVLNDDSFMDVELNTLITVFSFDHLNVDSELDLFHAVARYAEVESRRQGGPPEEGVLSSEELSEKVLSPSVERSSCKTSQAAELDSKPPTEEEPSIRGALQKIRFLSLSAAQFAEGPARSGLLTNAESLSVLTNIASKASAVPMPTGFTTCRRKRRARSDALLEAGSLDHIICALKSGDHSQVEDATLAAAVILCTPLRIQQALDKGILDALVPALTGENIFCYAYAAGAITNLCAQGSRAQLRLLAASAALQPYCNLLAASKALQPNRHLLAAAYDNTCHWVLDGLTDLLKNVDQNTIPDLLRKLRALGVPHLLTTVKQQVYYHNPANNLLQTYFRNKESVVGNPTAGCVTGFWYTGIFKYRFD